MHYVILGGLIMDIITDSKQISYSLPPIFNELLLDTTRSVLFDIETTGLNRNYDKVILIGVLYQEKENVIIKQFFCENSSEELELLKAFIATFKDFNLYITYNGANFDIPFLNKRFLKHNLNYQIEPYYNFDLYKAVRKNKGMLGLDNCKLKTVERFLGINRKDTIDGRESVRLFKKYEITKDISLKKKILLHNYEDILHLLPTLKILNFINKDRVFTHFPKEFSVNSELKIRILGYHINKDFLEVSGNFQGNLPQDIILYNPNYNFRLMKKDTKFIFKIPLFNTNIEGVGKYSFINLNEINYKDYNLSEIDNEEKLKYLVKIDNEIKDINIYNFIKDFSSYIIKSNL